MTMLSSTLFRKVLALSCVALMAACSADPVDADPPKVNRTVTTVGVVTSSGAERDPGETNLESPKVSTLLTTTTKVPTVTNTTMPTATTAPRPTTTIENSVIPTESTTTYLVQTFEPSQQPPGIETVEPNS
jgi:hypothetical protein